MAEQAYILCPFNVTSQTGVFKEVWANKLCRGSAVIMHSMTKAQCQVRDGLNPGLAYP